jgi:hypothetical protein
MKVTKWVDIPSMEIEVHISGEEAVLAIVSDEDGASWEFRLKSTTNNLAGFFKAVPDNIIAGMPDPVKQLVATFFREQAERFVPTPKTEGRTFDAAVDRVIARVDKGLEGKS